MNNQIDPLTKWSCNRPCLPKEPVKRLHIYDFDNTLFYSPSPNKSLYLYPTFQQLLSGDFFLTGGWWSDPVPLELLLKLRVNDKTLKSCWNPDMLKLTRMSHEQEDTISIVLTGRKEWLFKDILLNILQKSRAEDPELAASLHFNGICLKKCEEGIPAPHTLTYKTDLINDFLHYYSDLEEITIYDDRLNQINGFKKYFNTFQANFPKLQWFVIPVEPKSIKLPPYVEYVYFQSVITRHNWLSREGHSKLYKLQWAKPQYGYFLTLKSYQDLLIRMNTVLQESLLDDSTADYTLNVTNLYEYPCYIPCIVPHGKKLQSEIIYKIIKHGNAGPHVTKNMMATEIQDFMDGTFDSLLEDDNNKRNFCKYDFTLKYLGVKIQRINSEEKIIDLEVFVKFKPNESEIYCYSLYNQFNLVSHINDNASYEHDDKFNMAQLNEMINNKVYYKSCLEDPLIVKTTFGMFSKMKCIGK